MTKLSIWIIDKIIFPIVVAFLLVTIIGGPILIILAACQPAEYPEDAKPPSSFVYRYIDEEAGVVCFAIISLAISVIALAFALYVYNLGER